MRPTLESIVRDMRWLASNINANQNFEIMADFGKFYAWLADLKTNVDNFFINKLIEKLNIKNQNNEEFFIGDFVAKEWKGQTLVGQIIDFMAENRIFNICFYSWYLNEDLIDDFADEDLFNCWTSDIDNLRHVNKKDCLGLIKDANGKAYRVGDIITLKGDKEPYGYIEDFNIEDCTANVCEFLNADRGTIDRADLEEAVITGHNDKIKDCVHGNEQ